MKSICVYCGSSDKINQAYIKAAYQMGSAIANRGLQLWYGAGCTGLMGALANGALDSGGEVIGVIPKMFNNPTLAHSGLTRLEVVESMHERKQRLVEQVEAFIAMPGGYGTFEELFEILTWAQIGLHRKPVGLFNTLGYFDPLITTVEHASTQGFIYEEHLALFVHSARPDDLLDALENYQSPPRLDRWLTREDETH